MIYNLLSYVIYLFRYRNFNLADIDQFSENVTNVNSDLEHVPTLNIHKKLTNRPTRNILTLQ